MTKRLCSNEIWQKDWFINLPDKQKLLIKFLYDNCDCAGIYEISYRVLNMCFESEITVEDFKGLKQVKFVSENVVFLEDFIKFQYNIEITELNPKNNVHKGILRKLSKYGIFLTLPQGLGNPTPTLHVKDKVKDKVNKRHVIEVKEENKKEEKNENKNIDPLFDSRVSKFIEEYKKYFSFINTAQNRKLIAEVVADETIELWIEVFKTAKDKGHLIDGKFRPLSLKNLLKNYSKILEGTYQLVSNPELVKLRKEQELRNKIKNLQIGDEMPESFKQLGAKLKKGLSRR